jgi:hypothetical protein
MASREASSTLVHTLHRALFVERGLVLRPCKYAVRASALHHRDERDLVERHRDGRVAHELLHRRCIYAVRASAPSPYKYVERALGLHHRGERDLVERHRDERVVDELVLHLYMYVVRGLDDRLRSDLLSLLVFRRPCAVVCQKDSKRRYCALRHALQRVEIPRGYAHLGREEFEVREIRPLPPWYLAWRASWQQ